MEYKDLLIDHGYEYCEEYSPDNCLYEMELLEEIAFPDGTDPLESFTKGLYAYSWKSSVGDWEGHTEDFHLNDDYFAYDEYANLCSLTEYQVPIWYNQRIEKSSFIEWLIDNGYIEDESEITYDEPIGD